MAAHEYLQGEQLRMFIPARELMDHAAGHTEGYDGQYVKMSNSPKMYANKLGESVRGGWNGNTSSDTLYENIKKEGVKSPISLRLKSFSNLPGPQINDGHHRIASAHDIDPNMEVPVRYS
jgi:hypothetical protein